MESKVLTLLNQKGGIGKTTTATMLAAGCAYYGFRTLIVDMDSQGHVAVRHGIEPVDGVYYAMTEKAEERQAWHTLLRGVPPEMYGREGNAADSLLWILPSFNLTRRFYETFKVAQVVTLLHQWKQVFDFIIFDTSPQLGAIHTSLMVASDYLILPTECTRLSVAGLNSTINNYWALQKREGERIAQAGMQMAQIMGILPTRFNGKKSVHYQNLGFLDGRYGQDILVFDSIRYLTDWEKAESKLLPVFVYKPRGEAAQEAMGFVDAVLDRVGVRADEQSA